MKKTLLLFSAVITGIAGFAQLDSITNPNFDRWTGSTPDSWGTVNASKATGGNIHGGANTLVLSTTSGPTIGTASFNTSFRMRPLSLSYVSTYTPGVTSDAPIVQVTLTKTIGSQTVTLGSGSSTLSAASYGKQTLNINYSNAYKAFAPDNVQIRIASSGNTGAEVGSVLFIDSLAFVYNCNLDPNIVSSGVDPTSVPDGGSTVTGAVAGQPFTFHITNYIPYTSVISVPFGTFSQTITTYVDSVKTTNQQLTGSAANFMHLDPNIHDSIVGGNSISCISFVGNIPASPANALYNLIITPLMWGTSSAAPGGLHNFPSPATITIYIQVGAGSDTITATDNIQWETMQFNNKKRVYNVYKPTIYDGSKPVPLIFNVHGWTGGSTKQMIAEDFRPIADTANFLVVHPQALDAQKVPTWDLTGTSDTSDSHYLMTLLDVLEAKYNIDKNRIYCTGFSQGGQMSFIFGCSFSDRIAAVAPVAGGMQNPAACMPLHYLPVLEIHGTNDPLANYNSSVQPCLDRIVAINGCNLTPTKTLLPDITPNSIDSSTVEHWVYDGGKTGANVEHYKVLNGGHEIPSLNHNKLDYGLNARNNDFEAPLVIWQFFRKYSLNQLGSTGVEDVEDKKVVSVYPNPSNGLFTLFVDNYENAKVKVVDVIGKTVFEASLKSQSTVIDLRGSSKGVYFYQVQNKSGVVSNGKLIVE